MFEGTSKPKAAQGRDNEAEVDFWFWDVKRINEQLGSHPLE
jgi:hypothetical protein